MGGLEVFTAGVDLAGEVFEKAGVDALAEGEEDAESDFGDDNAGEALDLRIEQKGDEDTEVTDDVGPFAAEAVGDPAGGETKQHDDDGEDDLAEGDLALAEAETKEERGHDGHGEEPGGDDGLERDEAEVALGFRVFLGFGGFLGFLGLSHGFTPFVLQRFLRCLKVL